MVKLSDDVIFLAKIIGLFGGYYHLSKLVNLAFYLKYMVDWEAPEAPK